MSRRQGAFGHSTPFPNLLLDEVMPRLKDTEWKLLCLIVRQTLGRYDAASGGRKKRDWLTRSQLKLRTGRHAEALSAAIESLVRQGYITVQDSEGNPLSSADKRRSHRGRIYYGLAASWKRKIELAPSGDSQKAQTRQEATRKTEPVPTATCSVFGPEVRKSEHDKAGKPNGTKERLTKESGTKEIYTKETLTKEEPTKSGELIRDFVNVFEKTTLESAVTTGLVDGRVSTQLDATDTRKLGALLQKKSDLDWTPDLQRFFASDLEFVRSRQYSLAAFVNSYHILALTLRHPATRRK